MSFLAEPGRAPETSATTEKVRPLITSVRNDREDSVKTVMVCIKESQHQKNLAVAKQGVSAGQLLTAVEQSIEIQHEAEQGR